MIGDLAQNAGNFATGQAEQEMAIRANAQQLEAQRMQQAASQHQQQLDLEQQHYADQAQYQQGTLAQRGQHDQTRGAQQVDLEKLRHADRLEQDAARLEATGGSREEIQQMRDDAAMERTNARLQHGDTWNAANNDTRRYGVDQGNQTREDIAGQRNDLGRDRLAAQQQNWAAHPGADPNAVQYRNHVNTIGRLYTGVVQQMRTLQGAIQKDPYRVNPETQGAIEQLQGLQKQADEYRTELEQLAASQPSPQATAQPTNGLYAGDATPSMPTGGQPAQNIAPVDGSQMLDPNPTPEQLDAQPAPAAAPATQPAQPLRIPPAHAQLIQQMIQAGKSNEEIKAALRGQQQ